MQRQVDFDALVAQALVHTESVAQICFQFLKEDVNTED